MPNNKTAADQEITQTGILAILIAIRDDAAAAREGRASQAGPSELILADIGFATTDVARLTGRPYETVKARIRRARGRASERSAPSGDEGAGGEG